MEQMRVLFSSDNLLYHQSLSVAFDGNQAFKVLGNVSLDQLIERATQLQPDIIIWKPESADCIPILSELRSCCPSSCPVIISDNPDKIDLATAIHHGVRACLPVRLLPAQIVAAVELSIGAGLMCLPRQSSKSSLVNASAQHEEEFMAELSNREREIVALLVKGHSNAEMASELFLSESTVKTHLRNTFKKLQVHNRAEAIAILYGILKEKTGIMTIMLVWVAGLIVEALPGLIGS